MHRPKTAKHRQRYSLLCESLIAQRGTPAPFIKTPTSKKRHQPVACLQAAAYYAQAKNSDALADALYRLEDFEGLEQLTAALPEGSPLLLQMGEQFQSVGLCQQAAAAYIKVTPLTVTLSAYDCTDVLSQLFLNTADLSKKSLWCRDTLKMRCVCVCVCVWVPAFWFSQRLSLLLDTT